MINPSSNASKTREIPIADLHKTFSGQIATFDSQRAQSVTELADVRSAKSSTLAHEQNLLTRKFGSNSPRVAAIASQQSRNAVLQSSLSVEATRAQTPAPTVSAQSYVFHGYVQDTQRKPLQDLSVALYNEKGEWVRELGYGCTDENGYFIMRFDRAAQPKPVPTPQPAPSPQPTPQTSQTPSSAPAGKLFSSAISDEATAANVIVKDPSTDTITLNILVFDKQQKLIYRDPTPLQAQLGHVDYRVIIIGQGSAGTCTPPPDSMPTKFTDKKIGTYTPTRDIASMRKEAAQPVSAKSKTVLSRADQKPKPAQKLPSQNKSLAPKISPKKAKSTQGKKTSRKTKKSK